MITVIEEDDKFIVCRRDIQLGVVQKLDSKTWRATFTNGDEALATSKTKAIEKLTRFK